MSITNTPSICCRSSERAHYSGNTALVELFTLDWCIELTLLVDSVTTLATLHFFMESVRCGGDASDTTIAKSAS